MSERWMPKHGELYYYISTTGVVTPEKFNEYDAGKTARCFCGNCFRTVIEAESAAEKFKAFLLSLHDNETSPANDETLQDKPLPKLTAEVFDRIDCPENAKIAVVNDDGSAYWGSFNTARQNFRGGWNGENGSWFPIPGKWDSSDWQNSLVERPVKLPDWCKPGEWVYCTKTNNYGKVLSVDKEEVNICIPPDGTFSAKTNMMLKNGRTARLRPYNAAEMKALMGKVLEQKNGDAFLVTAYTPQLEKDLCAVDIDNMWVRADDVLKEYTIDGKLCGVLEHLENGEWVE